MNDGGEIAAPPVEIAAPPVEIATLPAGTAGLPTGIAIFPAGTTILPPRPEPPRPEDCCGSGCVHCIYAIYDDALLAWQREVARIRERDAKPI